MSESGDTCGNTCFSVVVTLSAQLRQRQVTVRWGWSRVMPPLLSFSASAEFPSASVPVKGGRRGCLMWPLLSVISGRSFGCPELTLCQCGWRDVKIQLPPLVWNLRAAIGFVLGLPCVVDFKIQLLPLVWNLRVLSWPCVVDMTLKSSYCPLSGISGLLLDLSWVDPAWLTWH